MWLRLEKRLCPFPAAATRRRGVSAKETRDNSCIRVHCDGVTVTEPCSECYSNRLHADSWENIQPLLPSGNPVALTAARRSPFCVHRVMLRPETVSNPNSSASTMITVISSILRHRVAPKDCLNAWVKCMVKCPAFGATR